MGNTDDYTKSGSVPPAAPPSSVDLPFGGAEHIHEIYTVSPRADEPFSNSAPSSGQAAGKKKKPARFADEPQKKPPLFLILGGVALLVLIAVTVTLTVMFMKPSGTAPTKPTVFVEQKQEVIKKGETITINDPLLGLIEIEAVAGAPKNTYDNDNFAKDENGYLKYYLDGKEASCIGIDLSEYQGDVDFEAVKASGIDYVMLRIGGRYYGEEGALFDDSAFLENVAEARAAGLAVGAYFFSQAATAEEGIEEAKHVISRLDGVKLDYPVAFDWETIADDEARTDVVTGEMLTDIAEAFCDTLGEAGYSSIIYSNTYLMYYMYDLERMKDYEFWVADYAPYPTMYYGFTMWQYSTDGIVGGIDGTVDLNVCFKNY